MTDLTTVPNNPAHALHAAYSELMQLNDPATLHDRVVQIVAGFTGRGASRTNVVRFQREAARLRRNLPALQRFVSNYVLKAAGLGVIR